jgi:DNA-binding transcriptional ArsR family regulator
MPYPHKFIKLTEEERKRLEAELKNLAITTECCNRRRLQKRRRLQAIYFSSIGWEIDKISKSLKVSYRSVKGWLSAYRKNGIEALIRDKK